MSDTIRRITKLRVNDFTAFEKLRLTFSPGINVFIGENGTGKSHLLKLLYSTLRGVQPDKSGLSRSKEERQAALASKLRGVFRPDRLGRLVRRALDGGARRLRWRGRTTPAKLVG